MKAWTATDVPTLPHPGGRLLVHDTALDDLVPVLPDADEARLYVCGITPYDATHLGHANTYLAFDLLQRALLDCGYRVTFTQNVTDVDDPLLERAEATGVDWRELADDQVQLFRDDMTALRVIPPQHYVGAVESIPAVVDLIESLKLTGAIYQVDDPDYPDWYFEVHRAPGFGRLSKLSDAEAREVFAERGGDPDRPGKRDPLDCLVWRMARPGEPAWDSRLGRGVRAGTSNARRSPYSIWAQTSTYRAAGRTWCFRTTRCARPRGPWPPGSRSRRCTCTPEWSACTARR